MSCHLMRPWIIPCGQSLLALIIYSAGDCHVADVIGAFPTTKLDLKRHKKKYEGNRKMKQTNNTHVFAFHLLIYLFIIILIVVLLRTVK